MADIGFYRYKIAKNTYGKFPVYFKRDGIIEAHQCVNFIYACDSGKILKFLDNQGLYRFYSFNEFWELNNKPTLIGSAERTFDYIQSGQSNSQSIGYKNEKSLSLVAYDVTASQLLILQDLMTSPFVYLYIGTTGDAPADWLLVTVEGTNIGRQRKGITSRYEVTVKLPEQFNISLL